MVLMICWFGLIVFLHRFNSLSAETNDTGMKLNGISDFVLVWYDTQRVWEQHLAACASPNDASVVIETHGFNRYFTLILRQCPQLFAPDIKVQVKSRGGIHLHQYDTRMLYTGTVAGDPKSSVTGHIRPDGTFDGSFFSAGKNFYLEPTLRYFKSAPYFHSILFQSRAFQNMSRGEQLPHWARTRAKEKFKISTRQKRSAILSDNSTNLNTCALHITADHLFLKSVGGGSVDAAVAEMVYHVTEVDKIFRSTDFNMDGGPGDNIGVSIAAITVYEDTYAEGELASPESIPVTDFLTKWSHLDHNNYCIALLFTYRDFADGVLGLAWVGDEDVGGVCSTRVPVKDSGENINFNTAVVSLKNFGARVLRKGSVLTTAHELGHSFGSEHDPDNTLCRPEGEPGYFIMYDLAVDGNKPNNFLFSECSKAQMWSVIFNKGPKCFIAQNQGAFCGNSIVEGGEECDCGAPQRCSEVDVCCHPGNITSGIPECRVKPEYQCSPQKGLCCESNCTLSAHKTCRKETECSYASFCNGTTAVCPEPIPKPRNTTCGDDGNTCLDGACVGPVCARYFLDQCECQGQDQMCLVCCRTKEGTCVPSMELNGLLKYKFPGSTCNSYTGYCNQLGQCITVKTGDQLLRLMEAFKRMSSEDTINAALTWLQANWYYVVLIPLGVVFVGLLLKFSTWQHNPANSLFHQRAQPLTTFLSGVQNPAYDDRNISDDDANTFSQSRLSNGRGSYEADDSSV